MTIGEHAMRPARSGEGRHGWDLARTAVLASAAAAAAPLLVLALAAVPGLTALLWGLLVVLPLSEATAVAGIGVGVAALVRRVRRRRPVALPAAAIAGGVAVLAAIQIVAALASRSG